MKKSEDVTRLFAMFGEEKTGQYQEIYKADKNREVSKRWPIFQSVDLDPDQQTKTAMPSPGRSQQLPPTPTVPEIPSGPIVDPTQAEMNTSQKASLGTPGHAESEGSLRSLFRRLESPDETPVQTPMVEPVIEAEVTTGSIRSLFSRLKRS